jgi:uncharacterized protein (TIGR01777 family)
MKIVIFGATGFIGEMLFTALLSEAYEITVVSRDVVRAREILGNNAEFCQWDGEDESGLDKIFTGAYAIINLAGESIASKRWNDQQKQKILQSRLSTTKAIVNTINQMETKPNVLIQASAIGFYGSAKNKTFDEDSAVGTGFLAEVCQKWEAATNALDENVRLVILRTGIVIGRGGGALEPLAKPFKYWFGGHVGSGKQWLSWIHLDDEVHAIMLLLENTEARGIFNLTAPEPVRMKVFSKELGRVLKKPSWFHVPAFAVKLLMGQMGEEMILSGQKVLPKRLSETGFKFQFSEIRMALTNIFNF